MILAGRVSLNGQVIKEMGISIDPEKDHVVVDGKEIRERPHLVYYIFHKPKNVMVTRHDPEGRPTIYDYLKEIPERVNYVGRLDFDSEGLVFLTNDGELHHRMTHPSKGIPKTYRVKIRGRGDVIRKLSGGVDIGGYVTAPCQVKILDDDWLEITITEGKNRQIRRMCEAVGLDVIRLIRVSIGSLQLGDLRPGQYRSLTPSEIEKITRNF